MIYKVSFVIIGRPHPGEIVNMDTEPRAGDQIELGGEMFEITRERVRQLQNMALSRMRKALIAKERQRSQEEIDEAYLETKRMEVLQEFYASNVESRESA